MGRASDRTCCGLWLGFNLWRGETWHFCFFFFLLSFIIVFLAANNNSLMSLNGDTQTSSNLYLGFAQDVKLRWYIGTKNTFIIIERGKEIVDKNSKSKWKEVFLTYWVNCKPITKDIIFVLWNSAYVSRLDICSFTWRKVPRSSVGRAPDRIMLQSVLGLNLEAGKLAGFFALFLSSYFTHWW